MRRATRRVSYAGRRPTVPRCARFGSPRRIPFCAGSWGLRARPSSSGPRNCGSASTDWCGRWLPSTSTTWLSTTSMAERETAVDRLARILAILPRAARAGGVGLSELARELGLTEEEVVRDLQDVCTREFYHPAGSGQDVQVTIEPDEVRVFTTREFRRPPRLSPREMLALGLGLRVLAADTTE